MKWILAMTLGLLLPAPFTLVHAQTTATDDPAPLAASSDLVAWSWMQQAQQVPPAGPQAQTPEPAPDTNPQQGPPAEPQASQPGAGSQAGASSVRGFTGTISKEAGSYVLKVEKGTQYKLDDQDKAQQFDGRKVKVTGSLNSEINLIRVDKIEPLT